jgi:N-acetylneuraminate synthase
MKKHPLESESISRNNARRSLVASKNIERGDIITSDSLTWKRPAHGISPKYINQVIGSKASTDIKEDDVLTWQMID